MSAQLHAELIRMRRHEVAAAASHSHHRRELLAARRAPRRSMRSLLPRFPRVGVVPLLGGGRAR